MLRPFQILTSMPAEGRRLLAHTLGCELQTSDPEAQAWRLINRNLRGLQARTHSLPELLSPFSRNNNWWEIVTRTAKARGIRFYPGLRDEEVERLLFEHLAHLFVQQQLPHGTAQHALDELAEANPELHEALQSLRLSCDGTRAVMSAMLLAAMHDGGLREGVRKATEWIRQRVRWPWRVSIRSGLYLLQQRLCDIYAAWIAQGFCKPGANNLARVSAALAVIYFQDLVDRTIAEFELVGR